MAVQFHNFINRFPTSKNPEPVRMWYDRLRTAPGLPQVSSVFGMEVYLEKKKNMKNIAEKRERRSAASSSDQLAPIAKPSCEKHCGDVTIPYPFGIGPSSNCYLYDWFEIECDYTTIPPRPFLRLAKLEVLSISIDGTLWVNNPVTFFYGGKGIRKVAPNLTGSPFVYSERYNRLTAVSCGFFLVVRSDENVVGGCMSTCDKNYHSRRNYGCIGINCCQTTFLAYLTAITIELQAEYGAATGGNDHMGMGTGT
ncbi:unnamed protein product [Prunus armeniaca]|uniref:Wall-associated receptor kinase galacturonan-binding domain-containing protein n=1 Tax=Prunus armeniaca TaxID=36596 RepID=A0A6J5UFP1_PRUAR|nr:unnamed protein product [Prunus armeniaca]